MSELVFENFVFEMHPLTHASTPVDAAARAAHAIAKDSRTRTFFFVHSRARTVVNARGNATGNSFDDRATGDEIQKEDAKQKKPRGRRVTTEA